MICGQTLSAEIAERIDWNAVNEEMRRRFSTFVAFLEDVFRTSDLGMARHEHALATVGADYRSRFRYRVPLLMAPFAPRGGIVPGYKQDFPTVPVSLKVS